MEYYSFDNVTHGSGMIRSCCKIHGGSTSSAFVMNEDNGFWYCHTGTCGGGDIYTLIRKLEGCSFKESIEKVASILGIDIDNLEIVERKDNTMIELNQWVRTMTSWVKKEKFKEYVIEEELRKVTKFRDFNESTLENFGLSYVDEISLESKTGTSYKLQGRLVIPIIQGAVQVGASLRKTKSRDYPKWSHQPIEIKTRNLLYNYDATSNAKSITIVEGPFDVWAYYEIGVTAVATYGAHLTNEQYRLLVKTGADLVFSFDGDRAGREATEKAIEMLKNKANMEFVLFDEGEDPASLSREELKTKYEKRGKLWGTQSTM